MNVDPRAAAAAAAHRRVKRAMGLLRAAAATLAPDALELDLVGELRLEGRQDLERLAELVELALDRRAGGPLDVVILAPPRPAAASPGHPPAPHGAPMPPRGT